jgi:PAS domain S-box-containing protein
VQGDFDVAAKELGIIAEIARIVSSSPNLDDVFSAFANQANKLVPFDRLAISTIDPNTGLLSDSHISGLQLDGDYTIGPNSLEDSPVPAAVYKDHEVVSASAEILASIAHGDIAMGNDVLTRAGLKLKAGLKSAMFAPVVLQGQMVGTLVFRSKQDDPFGEREKRLASQIAVLIAGVIASTQQIALREAESTERRRIADEQTVVAEIGRVVSSTLDLDEVFTQLVEQARKLFRFDRIVISLFSEDRSEYVDRFVSGHSFEGSNADTRALNQKSKIIQQVTVQKQHLMLAGEDLEKYAAGSESETIRFKSGLEALLVVPLIWQNEASGMITFRAYDPDAFGKHQIDLALQVSRQIAGATTTANRLAIAARESSERQQLVEEQTAIAEIGRIVSSTLDLNEVFSSFADQVRDLLPFNRLVISLVDEGKTTITDAFVDGQEIDDGKPGNQHPLSGDIKESVVRRNSTLVVNKPEQAKPWAKRGGEITRLSAGLVSVLIVPLAWQGEVVGALSFRSVKEDVYGAHEVNLAERVGAQIAGAVASANQYSKLEAESSERQQLADEQARISEIGRIVSSTLDIKEVLTAFTEQARSLVPFDRLVISTMDDNDNISTDILVDGMTIESEPPGFSYPSDVDLAFLTAIQDQGSLVLSGTDYTEHASGNPIERTRMAMGIKTILIAPLIWQGKVVGIIKFRSVDPQAYGEHQIDLAVQIGAQIAGAIATSDQVRQLEAAAKTAQTQVAALEAADDAIIIRNSDMTVEYVNPAFEKQSGFSSDEILGTIFETPETKEVLRTRDQRLKSIHEHIQQGDVWREHLTTARKDGTEYIVDAKVSAILNDEGEIDKFVGIRRDVTEQFRADADRRTQAAAINAADDAIIIHGLDRTIEYVNPAFERQTGLTMEEVVGSNPLRTPAINKLGHDGNERLWKKVEAGETARIRFEDQQDDGTERLYEGTLSPIFDEQGEIVNFVGIRRDVTESVNANAEIRTQAAALEAASDAVVILNLDTSIEWVNEAFVRDTGYSREEAIGQRSPFMRSDKSNPELFDNMWEQVRSGNTWRARMWIRRKDGSDYEADTSVTPVFDDDDNITRFIGIRRDITELAQAEKDREATRDLDAQNQQLLQLNEQREEFFSTVSHELRTPLTSVMAFADILSRDRDGNLTNLQHDHIDVIKRNGRNLNALVEDMLDFSRMSTDQLKLDKSEFEIHSLLDSVIESLEPTAEQRSQTLVIEPHTAPVWISADHGRIIQILSNLITNSCKYSPPSTRITVKVDSEDEKLILVVSDHGIGIPQENLTEIFSPFFRTSHTEVREEIGTGLGLAITKTLVDLHGGNIKAESKLNVGTDITVVLPGALPKPSETLRV